MSSTARCLSRVLCLTDCCISLNKLVKWKSVHRTYKFSQQSCRDGDLHAVVCRRPEETLNGILAQMNERLDLASVSMLAADLHVYPDFHGNRSPLADPGLRGMVGDGVVFYLIVPRSLHYSQKVVKDSHKKRKTKMREILYGEQVRTLLAQGVHWRVPLSSTGCTDGWLSFSATFGSPPVLYRQLHKKI